MRRLTVILLTVLFLASGVAQSDIRKLVRVNLSGQPEATFHEFLQHQPNISFIDRDLQFVDVIVTSVEGDSLERLGFKTEVLIDDIDTYTLDLVRQGYFEPFHSYEEMVEAIQAAEAAHPDIVRIHDIGDGWDKIRGWADRDIWAVKISDNVDTEETDEPEVLYIACHHGSEIMGVEILLSFMDYLLDRYGSDSEVTLLVDSRQLWLVPILNPDGHALTFSGVGWRKNKRDNDGDGIFDTSIDGVDLNRNYGYMWGIDDAGSSPNFSAWNHRGPYAFSEPESRAIRDLANAHRFIISLSYHSCGSLWLYSWQYTRENTPDHDTFVHLASNCVAYNGYTPMPQWAWYLVNGGSEDWLYGEQTTKEKTYAFTVEVTCGADSYTYPDNPLVGRIIEDNLGPNLYVAKAAGQYITQTSLRCQETVGNGDGILDPGETVNFYVRLRNDGLEGARGITARLETDDPDIIIIDNETVYPEMGLGETAENLGEPFSFSVSPEAAPHSLAFTLHLAGGDGIFPAVIPFRLYLGQGVVLLVADDGPVGNSRYYIEALEKLGISYELVEFEGVAKATFGNILDYEEVIWFTGPVEDSTLTPEDQNTLKTFLDGGGRLLFSGSLIGYDIGDTPFYREYLHGRYVSFMTRLHHLNGGPSNPVVVDLDITLSSTGENAQTFAGETDPVSPAVSIFNYDQTTEEGSGIIQSSGSGALAVETADYKVVYFSFGLEGIEPLEDRAQVVADVLSWFKVPGIDKGDVDGNGTTNVLDVVMAVNIVLSSYQPTEEEEARADMNYDGQINVVDIVQIVNAILGV